MPFTPFHFGPGLLLKSLTPRWFSFRIFLLTQFFIDLETAWNILRGHERLHTFFHTYLGSLVVIFLVLVSAHLHNMIIGSMKRLGNKSSIFGAFEFRSTLVGATLGVLSHVFLDSIMHADMMPLEPFSNSNPLFHRISVLDLHLFCLFSFAMAGIVYGFKLLMQTDYWRQANRKHKYRNSVPSSPKGQF